MSPPIDASLGHDLHHPADPDPDFSTPDRRGGGALFWRAKRVFDLVAVIALAPMIGVIALALLAANPVANRGPLFFTQTRMGRGCRPITVWKFRTMLPAPAVTRGHDDPVETDRITRLGGFLRRTRLDELPQFWNVFCGEMSLIGPRPDFYEHAKVFAATVPGYRARHAVRPGISGLAQVRMGYAEGAEQTRIKTRTDLAYIRSAGWRVEAYILRRTLKVMATGFGAR